MPLGPFALFKLKVFNSLGTSSGVVGDKKNVFALLFVKKSPLMNDQNLLSVTKAF